MSNEGKLTPKAPRWQGPKPAMIVIPWPVRSVAARGISSNKKADPQRTIRIGDDDWSEIQESASILGLTPTEMVRWLAMLGAAEILRQYASYLEKNEPAPPPKQYRGPTIVEQIRERENVGKAGPIPELDGKKFF